MALNFPNSPYNGQVYTDPGSGSRYVYDSTKSKWVSGQYVAVTAVDTSEIFNKANSAFLVANAAFSYQNVDYTLSNTAFSVANLAFDTANAAFGSANNVSPQVTPSYNTANASYNFANSAYASINSNWTVTNALYTVANSAYGAANNVGPQIAPTFNTANAAYNFANSAYASINSNWTVLNVVYSVANSAYGAANNVGPQIAPTYNTANSAYGKANAALANTSGTFAGSLNTTGTITANSYLYVTAIDGTGNEGGEIQLSGAGTYTGWSLDAYQNNYRIFARTGTTVSNVNFFHAIGGGSIRMGVNKNDPLYTLDVNGGLYSTSLGVGTGPSGTTGEIRATNNITAYYSDGRLKTIISTIPSPLEKLNQLSGVIYINNETASLYGYNDKSEQVGVIAQQVEKVLPQIVKPAPFDIELRDGVEVSKSGENYKTVQYDKLIPLLIEAIKELKAEIDELRKR